MANELRQYAGFDGGHLDTKIDTTAGGSFTFSSPGFANLPAVDASHHMMLSIDPFGLNGAPEVVKVTAHTAAATTLTATGAQGVPATAGRVHYKNETWVAAIQQDDLGSNGDSAWIVVGSGGSAPAFTNSWAQPATGTEAVQFRRLSNGTVILTGQASALAATSSAIFTLPVGYRPLNDLFAYPAAVDQGGSVVFGVIDITAAGVVNAYVASTFVHPTTWASLMGVSFFAEQ